MPLSDWSFLFLARPPNLSNPYQLGIRRKGLFVRLQVPQRTTAQVNDINNINNNNNMNNNNNGILTNSGFASVYMFLSEQQQK